MIFDFLQFLSNFREPPSYIKVPLEAYKMMHQVAQEREIKIDLEWLLGLYGKKSLDKRKP